MLLILCGNLTFLRVGRLLCNLQPQYKQLNCKSLLETRVSMRSVLPLVSLQLLLLLTPPIHAARFPTTDQYDVIHPRKRCALSRFSLRRHAVHSHPLFHRPPHTEHARLARYVYFFADRASRCYHQLTTTSQTIITGGSSMRIHGASSPPSPTTSLLQEPSSPSPLATWCRSQTGPPHPSLAPAASSSTSPPWMPPLRM